MVADPLLPASASHLEATAYHDLALLTSHVPVASHKTSPHQHIAHGLKLAITTHQAQALKYSAKFRSEHHHE
jgi:hypothetical protein